MSSDQYAQHIIQKYRLAVAIAVLQIKPEDISLNKHITDLRNKMSDDKIDEFTLCSDDFDVDFDDNDFNENNDKLNDASQHSDTILKDFDDIAGGIDVENSDIFSSVIDWEQESRAQIRNDENDIQSTFCETQPLPDIYIARESLTDIDKTFCDSVANMNQSEIIALDKTCDNIAQIYQNNNGTVCENVGQFHENQISDADKTFDNILLEVHDNFTMDIDQTVCESLPQVSLVKDTKKQQITKRANIDKAKTNFENTYCSSVVKTNKNIATDVDQTFCESIKQRENAQKNCFGVNIDRNADASKQYLNRTTAYDSQATELYTFDTFEENYTHVSQSQNQNFDVSDKFIKGISKDNDNRDTCKNIEESLPINVINTDINYNLNANLTRQINKNSTVIQEQKYQNTQTDDINPRSSREKGNLARKIQRNLNKEHVGMQIDEDHFDRITQTSGDVNISRNRKQDAHDQENTNTEFNYNLKDANVVRNVNTQIEIINFDAKTANDDNNLKDNRKNDYNLQETQNPFSPTNDVVKIILWKNTESQNTTTVHEISKSVLNNENKTMQVLNFSGIDEPLKTGNNNNSLPKLSKTDVKNEGNMNIQVFNTDQDNLTVSKNKILTDSVHEISKTVMSNENMTMQVNLNQYSNQNHLTDSNDIAENESISSEELSQSELVPFKVMEELNRVRAYVNGRERRMSNESSLDSGYRSDSQGRSRSALQFSGNWVGQSAYCLYEHITRCPMVATTQDIVEEIAQVLGQLIDRLHEEESYPSFLEELLECVDSLIRDIFSEEDMLLEKDEKIQRLFLLNQSSHIQKYTMEKLTDLLEDTHARLTDKEELYELTNIQKMENLSYIFHILEVIIKKHLKLRKNYNSQSQSQETEKYPKKSSITDIWRKKWNPNFKEPKIDISLEKKCVFVKCSEILNKIVVGCMDGYSLVAFAALQCFNLLQ